MSVGAEYLPRRQTFSLASMRRSSPHQCFPSLSTATRRSLQSFDNNCGPVVAVSAFEHRHRGCQPRRHVAAPLDSVHVRHFVSCIIKSSNHCAGGAVGRIQHGCNMPRRQCKCRRGKCASCKRCVKCQCKCVGVKRPRESCKCKQRRCRDCGKCVACTCQCRRDPRKRVEESKEAEEHIERPPKRLRVRVAVATRDGAAAASCESSACDGDVAPSPLPGDSCRDVLRYLTAVLPPPPVYGTRQRKPPGWDALLKAIPGAYGKIQVKTSQSDAMRKRLVSLYNHLFRNICLATMSQEVANELIPLLGVKLQGK